MAIYLGNLSLEQIEQRLGISLTEEERKAFDHHQELANVTEPNDWHCFDIPFMIVCGTKAKAEKIRDALFPYHLKMKSHISIGWVKE